MFSRGPRGPMTASGLPAKTDCLSCIPHIFCLAESDAALRGAARFPWGVASHEKQGTVCPGGLVFRHFQWSGWETHTRFQR